MARFMTAAEEKYFATKLAGDPTLAAFLNNQVNNGQDFMSQAAKLPVCDRCESGALAHGTGYRCPHCGFQSDKRSLKVRDYISGGHWR
jgi:hypothetical protein